MTVDDGIAIIFLVGLALSTVPICEVALTGCLLSSTVILGAMVGSGLYYRECTKIREAVVNKPLTKIPKMQVKDMVSLAV